MARTSAGILLWRRGSEGAVEVFLAHPGGPLFATKDDAHWSVPKGEYDIAEEAPLAAARREFAEETGFAVPAGEAVPLGESRQSSGKVNTVWAVEGDVDAAAVVSNLFTMEWPPRSGRRQEFPEMDRAAWFGLEQARAKVFASQLVFLDRLAALLTVEPAPS